MLEFCVNGKFYRSEAAVNPTFGAWWLSLEQIVQMSPKMTRSQLISYIEEFEAEVIEEREGLLDDLFDALPAAPLASDGSSSLL